jgi:hypothetical protein
MPAPHGNPNETTTVQRAQQIFEELRAAGRTNQEIFEALYFDLK